VYTPKPQNFPFTRTISVFRKVRFLALLTGVFLFIASSCTLEQKIGQKFFKEAAGNYAVMVIPPDFLYKTNLKTGDIEGFKNMTKAEQDSALFQNSHFIKEISDSTFLAGYITSLMEQLSFHGIKLYGPADFDGFLKHKGQNYVVSLAQAELEEYIKVVTTEEILGEEDYYQEEFTLNALNVNSWFEVARLNDTTTSKKQILYASHYIFDSFESRLVENPFTGDVVFKYAIDSLTIDDVYSFGKFLGMKYAEYLYDYFMNAYIFEKFPAEKEPAMYLHFDHKRRITYPAENDRFIFME